MIEKKIPRKAYSYIRMSTEAQLQGSSKNRQLGLTLAYIKKAGLILQDDLQDIGLSAYSGKNVSQGKLGLFLQDIEDKKVDPHSALIVESLDRLSREVPLVAFKRLAAIISHGVEVHTLFDGQIYSTESVAANPGQLFTLLGYMMKAYSESEDKSKRLKKAWEFKRGKLDQKILTSLCPAWLKPAGDKRAFEIIPDRVATIEKIYELYIDHGMGAYAITAFLNENISQYPKFVRDRKPKRGMSIPTTGWHRSYVIKILSNPAVHGEFQPKKMKEGKQEITGDAYTNYFPVVIPKLRFNLARVRADERGSSGGGRKGVEFNNLFTKLVVCGQCQGSVHYLNKGQPSKGGRYLQCYNSFSHNSCQSVAWRYEHFEKSFLSFVSELDLNSIINSSSQLSERKRLSDQLSSVTQDILKHSKKLDALLMADLGDSVTALLQAKLEKMAGEVDLLKAEKQELETDLNRFEAQATSANNADLQAFIDQLTSPDVSIRLAVRRKIHAELTRLIDKIVLHNWSGPFYAWEAFGTLLPMQARQLLKDYAVHDEDSVTALFDNAHGRLLFDDMTRSFTVYFKSGEKRLVHPYAQKTWIEAKTPIETFIKNEQNRLNASALTEQKRKLTAKRKSAKKSSN